MSYESYTERILRERGVLRAELTEKNKLRTAAQLPLYDVEEEVVQQIPLESKESYEEDVAFRKFYREERKKYPPHEELMKGVTSHMTAMARGISVDGAIKRAWEKQRQSASRQ